MSYKIEVVPKGQLYETTLFKRKYLLFWEYVTHFYSMIPYHETGIYWKEKYNIPDKRYIFKL